MNAALPADWPAPPGVVAFTTLRHGAGVSQAPFDAFNLGARCGDDAGAVATNRDRLIAEFSLPSAPHWLAQVHGTRAVRFAGRKDDMQEPEADAAVTSAPATVLAILTADCLPVVFAAADGSEIAAAHAGWRGLAAGVLENTVAALQAPADGIVAWLGPAAGPGAYEIGEEVFGAFVSRDPQARSAFAATRPGHWRVDLYALARQRLQAVGVRRIHGGGLCTISDPQRFFSHRRDRRTGRMATLVYRKP
ncbi:peptidoglycan editing factor PgeF [Luteimonas sp. SX5]|uniref:Purine nucleoside phosphorylase n=1 Tax=Luteimonas galliterrae TaxID=2940486 RepID=A0ABT0MJT2_9GAMM|nr:peptidoglycan editing factor PgeF [Luteimonas galliterrae]MCL1634540.1 peptidoglycan editing factor PgeF [Luteimonas galliterrae]